VREVEGFDRGLPGGHTGVEHHAADGSDLSLGGVEGFLHRRRIRDVGQHETSGEIRGRLLSRRLVPVGDDHLVTAVDKPPCRRESDAAAATGDQRRRSHPRLPA